MRKENALFIDNNKFFSAFFLLLLFSIQKDRIYFKNSNELKKNARVTAIGLSVEDNHRFVLCAFNEQGDAVIRFFSHKKNEYNRCLVVAFRCSLRKYRAILVCVYITISRKITFTSSIRAFYALIERDEKHIPGVDCTDLCQSKE